MSKYIVTGGAGFIGSHVQDLLIEQGHDVHVVDMLVYDEKRQRSHLHPEATFHKVDIRDFEALLDMFDGADGVFHLAALPRMQYSIEEPILTNGVNISGTLNVLIAARDAGVPRVVYSASSSAYGDSSVLPLTEDLPIAPTVPYAIQKEVGERYCVMASRFYGLETVCLRYFNVYGPRQTTDADGPYATVIGIFLGQREKGQPMTIVPGGDQRRDFTHVTDIARANYLAMLSAKVGQGEIINIGTGKSWSILEVAGLIGGPIVQADPREGEAQETLANIEKAQCLLDWSPETYFIDGINGLKRLHGLL